MFVVGNEYENRRGQYVVLEIKGKRMLARYADGEAVWLEMSVQERILSNMGSGRIPRIDEIQAPGYRRHSSDAESRIWSQYEEWNSKIYGWYFGPGVSGRLAYLDVDEQELTQITSKNDAANSSMEDFVGAVKRTLELRKGDLLDRHFEKVYEWRQAGHPPPPPFIGLLALFCLAAQRMRGDRKFNASNYYDRLAGLLLGVSYTERQKQALTIGFRRAHFLWDELELWLIERGGSHGLPSALPMYGLSHIGYPISQSLLRSHDRQKLADLFLNGGLSPGHAISPRDMERLMDPWIATSALSQSAKTSWENGPARHRMAEVASQELSNWDGTVPETSHGERETATTQIAIEARVLRGPAPRIIWSIAFRMPANTQIATFDACENSQGLPLPLSDAYARSVEAQSGLLDGWSESITEVSMADFLVSRLEMAPRGGGSRAVWIPRKALVLVWDDETKVYRSKHHLEFGNRSLVLAHSSVYDKVSEALSSVDSGGMGRIPDPWGVPEGWVALQNVRPRRILDTGGDPDLECLVPAVWSSVEWNEGIALPGRKQWLSSRLPKVSVNSIDEVHKLNVELVKKSLRTPSEAESTFEVVGNAIDIDLAALKLADGVYGLNVMAYRRETDSTGDYLARRTFEAKSPDSGLGNGPESLLHRSDSPSWTISAAPPESTPEQPSVTVTGALALPECASAEGVEDLPHVLGNMTEARDENLMGPGPLLFRTHESAEECFGPGHLFVLKPVLTMGEFQRSNTPGECKWCGLKKTFRPKEWSKVMARESTRSQSAQPKVSSSSAPIVRPATAIGVSVGDHDGLLDACLTMGGGPWRHFELLARQASDAPAFPLESVQLMSALGHIDIELEPSGRRVKQWKVAPSVLVITAHGHLYLAGHRSHRLIESIGDAVRKAGGRLDVRTGEEGPTAYWITGLGQEAVPSVVESVKEDSGETLLVAMRPDFTIAKALTPLRDVLATAHTASGPLEADLFDASTASWAAGSATVSDGLYRTDAMPRSYLFRRDRIWYQVSYRIGKYLASAFEGKSLLAYNVQDLQLECPLGAQLPALYERAVVLSSGLPPLIDRRQSKVFYRRVPRDVASSVWLAIYGDLTS